jgi:hypothetical protein
MKMFGMLIRALLLGTVVLAPSSVQFLGGGDGSAQAAEDDDYALARLFSLSGIRFVARVLDDKPSLDILADRRVIAQSVPLLQAAGALNPDLTTFFVNTHPFTLPYFVARVATPYILKKTFENRSFLHLVSVKVIIVYYDEFGQERRELAASFDFTSALYQKVNWERFDVQNLSKVAMNYQITPFMQQKMNQEELW